MSKYMTIETSLTDEKCLIEALEALGIPFEVHAGEGANLFGYQGDRRNEKANVIVRRSFVAGASNDLGFKREKDGSFRVLLSDYDSGQVHGNGGAAIVKNVAHQYNQVAYIKEAKKQGMSVVSTTKLPNGKVQVKLRGYR